MTEAEFRILDMFVEMQWPLYIFSLPDYSEYINYCPPTDDRAEVVDLLHTMFDRGDIHTPRAPDRRWTKAQIENVIASHEDLVGPISLVDPLGVALTPTGGAMWETAAKPDWKRYFTYRGSFLSDIAASEKFFCALVVSARRERAEQYMAMDLYCDDEAENQVIPGSVRGRWISPWRATYWKTLPTAFCLRWKYKSVPIPEDHQRHVSRTKRSDFQRWYVDPFRGK